MNQTTFVPLPAAGAGAALLVCASFAAQGADIELNQPYAQVMKAAGKPTAEWSTALCPDRHIVLYAAPGKMLKLVFDKKKRLHAVGFAALRKAPGGLWPALEWPGVRYRISDPRPYGQQAGSVPWYYNLSSKGLSYFETTQLSGLKSGEHMYLGSVTVNEASSFASGHNFPFIEAQVATADEDSRQTVSRSPEFAPLRQWRSKTKPNAFVRVAAEAAGQNAACSGFFVGQIDHFDLSK